MSPFLIFAGAFISLVALTSLFLSFQKWAVSAVFRTLRHAPQMLSIFRTGSAATALAAMLGIAFDSEAILVVSVFLLIATLIFNLAALHYLRIPVSQSTSPETVLVIAAHPDDLEIACGATIAKFVDSGHRVFGMVMTNGSQGGDAAIRPYEARRGASFLGMEDLQVLDLPDRCLEQNIQEMVALIEDSITDIDPALILTHSQNEVHQDHAAVHTAVLRAARNHHSILCFESPSVTSDFAPSIYIDVTDYDDVKMAAISAHADQLDKPYMTRDVVNGITSFRGRQARVSRAEAFEVVRLQLNQPIPF